MQKNTSNEIQGPQTSIVVDFKIFQIVFTPEIGRDIQFVQCVENHQNEKI